MRFSLNLNKTGGTAAVAGEMGMVGRTGAGIGAKAGARAGARTQVHQGGMRWVGAGFAVLALAGWAVAARAQDGVIVSHAITTFGDPPKYPADFPHLDYVNPDAPKGGEISIWTAGGYDSLNPYSVKGRAAALSSAPYEAILTGTSDEIGTVYCLLCETMEYPEDRFRWHADDSERRGVFL
jgi:microcin C transport system substrate-binding protein